MDESTSKEPIASCRILLIEDNADARESLRILLEASGHQVHEAVDGPSGVEKALVLKPDVVLIDLGLPGLDGTKWLLESGRHQLATPASSSRSAVMPKASTGRAPSSRDFKIT